MRQYPLNVAVPLQKEIAGVSVRPRAELPNANTLPVGAKIKSYSGPGYFGDPARLPRVRGNGMKNGSENQPHFDAFAAGEIVNIERSK